MDIDVNHHAASITHLLPILVHIQNHLDEVLSLAQLSRRACYSEFHFHRMFKEQVGETVKSYTQRLRLERAAFDLQLERASVTEIAMNLGFRNPETFSRAFKRHFGVAPALYRRNTGLAQSRDPSPPGKPINAHALGYELSRTRIRPMDRIHLAFIRHIGPYVDVDAGLFDELLNWSKGRDMDGLPTQLIGMGHDAPGITPENQLRFDACLQVPKPFAAQGRIAHQILPAGDYAVTTYVGPLGQTMVGAYQQLGQQLRELKGIEIIGLPVVEIYRSTRINPDYALNYTDICIPIRRL